MSTVNSYEFKSWSRKTKENKYISKKIKKKA